MIVTIFYCQYFLAEKNEIDPRRLEFDPAAALCITCARAEEYS